MPEVNQAIEMPLGHGDLNLFARYQLGKILRDDNYDHAYVLPNSAKSALVPLFAKIPVRTGWKGEMRYGLLNDLRNNKKSFNLMIDTLPLFCTLPHSGNGNDELSGCLTDMPHPKLTIDISTAQNEALTKFGLNRERTVIGLCPGAEFGPAKRWPEQHFAKAATTLMRAR